MPSMTNVEQSVSVSLSFIPSSFPTRQSCQAQEQCPAYNDNRPGIGATDARYDHQDYRY
jgi:hypothetical protein